MYQGHYDRDGRYVLEGDRGSGLSGRPGGSIGRLLPAERVAAALTTLPDLGTAGRREIELKGVA